MKNIPFQPLDDRILVVRTIAEKVTEGGVLLPDEAVATLYDGIVVKAGPGRYDSGHLVPMNVKVGDHVMFDKYSSGQDIVINDELFVLLRQGSITGIFTQESESSDLEGSSPLPSLPA